MNLLNKEDAQTLRYNYKLLRLIENALRLIYDDSTDLLDFKKVKTETILKLLKHHGYEVYDLKETLEKVTKNIREIYLQNF